MKHTNMMLQITRVKREAKSWAMRLGLVIAGGLTGTAHSASTLDYNSLVVGQWHARAYAGPAYGDFYGTYAVQGNPNEASCAVYGTPVYAYWSLIDGGGTGTVVQGMGYTHGIGAGTVSRKLLDAHNQPTGWSFSLGYPNGSMPIPYTGNAQTHNQISLSWRLDTRGADLIPGETYHIDFSGLQYTHQSGAAGKVCAYSTSSLTTTGWSKTQSGSTSTTVASFEGFDQQEGTILDGKVVGAVSATMKGGVGGQTVALRWDGATWVSSPSNPGPRFTVLKNGTGGTMTVGLNCGDRNSFVTNVGTSPEYIYSDSISMTCNIEKVGDESVVAGEYEMRIQAAVRRQ